MLDKLLTHPIAIAQIVLIILALLQIPYLSTAIVYLGISFYTLASIIMLSTFTFTGYNMIRDIVKADPNNYKAKLNKLTNITLSKEISTLVIGVLYAIISLPLAIIYLLSMAILLTVFKPYLAEILKDL